MLDARAAVRNLGEIVLAELLLLLEAERAMIGGDHLQLVRGQSGPEFLLVPLLAQRRREDVFGALESRYVEIVQRKVQVLRAGLRVGRQAAVAGLAHFLQRLVAGQVHDVDRRARHFRERDGAARGLGLGGCGSRQGVVFRRRLAFGQRVLDDHIDGAAVLGVHANQRLRSRRP